MRRWLPYLALVLASPVFMGDDCGGGSPSDTPPAPASWTNASGTATVDVQTNPFALTIRDKDGNVLLESAPSKTAADPADPARAYSPLAITHNTDLSTTALLMGWDYYKGEDGPWTQVAKVTSLTTGPDGLTLKLATSDAAQPAMTVSITSQGSGVHVVASVDPSGASPDAAANRVSMSFKLHDDDHFMGFGERFVYSDHRGQFLYSWVEDGGFGRGEDVPPGPGVPAPSGPAQTNIPIPWFMDPRGFGLLFNTTFRTRYHLGDDATDAYRVEATEPKLDFTVFADKDPLNLVEDLTAITGRPPEIADWVLAPRRRGNIGSGEMSKLRAAHIPTSVIDTALHYFPNGIGSLASTVKQVTADIHSHGFKAITYFCPFVADSFHPDFDEAVAKGYLVKHQGGTPYIVFDIPYNAGMVDFTNPDAVAWYQAHMQQALDDGWDGWMYDFAEYVPQDAVMFNGMTGFEAHNLYPTLYQKAAFDLLEKQKKKDYLIFVRSGYLGTGGRVPMVWAGDQDTDFSLSDGLPAALNGALNAGMSGIPLWGSDISGYHYLYNPPPDKEEYLRWTELGAFSADMHDENEGAGNGPVSDRWQIWNDQESQDVYRTYASLHTRLLPYLRVAVREARDRGTPVMRHLYLYYPKDPHVYALGDEYMLGDSLLVAPVVQRGSTSREVYLPDAAYYDYFTGARVTGGGNVDVAAALGQVPVFAKVGAIVPLLAQDVETLVPATDGSGVVSMADRADVLEADVFAGGSSEVALDDGTTLSQTAPQDAFDTPDPTAQGATLVAAAQPADLQTCDACFVDDPASRTLSITLRTQGDTVTAGPLSLTIKGSPVVKRFLLRVHH